MVSYDITFLSGLGKVHFTLCPSYDDNNDVSASMGVLFSLLTYCVNAI